MNAPKYDTLFTITVPDREGNAFHPQWALDISELSQYPNEAEVMFYSYSAFEVVSYKEESPKKDGWIKHNIVLKGIDTCDVDRHGKVRIGYMPNLSPAIKSGAASAPAPPSGGGGGCCVQ